MMMDPKDQKPELNPGNNWEQDLESVRSALSGLESVEPPDLLDQAVLNTARRELSATRPRPVRWPIRWVGAFATAAVAVLALSIVVQQDQKTPDPRSGNGIKLDAARPAAAGKKNTIGASVSPEFQLTSPQSPAALSSEEPLKMEAQTVEHKRQKDAASNVAAAPPTETDSAAKTAMKQVSEENVYRPADAPDLAESREHFEDESLDMPVVTTRDADAEEEPGRAAQAGTLSLDSNLLEKAEDVSDEIMLTPDAWIEYMFELQKTERYEELKIELEAFRKAYPAHPLPSQLRN
jgi:hypothetical protein